MPKELTLLVCCHNHGSFLHRMLQDVFAQTLKPDRWKLLIVFDECTDGSAQTFDDAWLDLCSIQGKNLTWLECNTLVREKKEGLAACKNFGIEHCDTEFIAYLDADDGMMPNRLEMQLNFLQSSSGRAVDVCGTNAWDRDGHGRLLVNCFSVGQYQYHAEIAEALRRENIMCHGSVMLRREAWQNAHGYDTSDKYLGYEDWHFWRKLMAGGKKFYNIPERLYIWSMGTSVER